MNPLVSVTIVTHNSRKYMERCLESVFEQEYWPLEVVIVDNASVDGCAELLGDYEDAALVLRNCRNVGFAAGQNQAIQASHGDWVLTLNPDVLLLPGFIERLVAAGSEDAQVGVACGKLLRATPELGVPAESRIDSAGLFFAPNLRHFDRGWNEPDDGRFSQIEYVFGASAAAALYRRAMISEITLDECFFDSDFFSYREDADVAWRAQLLGWRCLYVPAGVGYHVRSVVPSRRASANSFLRMHSVKNRFLMRIKNATADLYRRTWLATTARDAVVVGACFLREPASLPAFWHLARCLPGALAKRRWIMSRRRASDDYMAGWFRSEPMQLAGASPDLAPFAGTRQ
jgi:GT2 family glycosyltransferase